MLLTYLLIQPSSSYIRGSMGVYGRKELREGSTTHPPLCCKQPPADNRPTLIKQGWAPWLDHRRVTFILSGFPRKERWFLPPSRRVSKAAAVSGHLFLFGL